MVGNTEMTVEKFIDRLCDAKSKNCFNPYADLCPVYDRELAPEIRRRNLADILSALEDVPQIDIWIGRDLGYRGGRRTGLALTDECSLELYAAHLGISSLRRATKGPAVKERTAANVFQVLSGVDVPVLTWNVFPFHPHNSDNIFSNRQHTPEEARMGFSFLEELVELFCVRQVVAIGNDAAKWAVRLSSDCVKVRHPSYGGQTEFLSQMNGLYSWDRCGSGQLTLL